MKMFLYILIVFFFGFISCKKDTPMMQSVNDHPTTASDTIGTGSFVNLAHSTTGDVVFYADMSGDKILRLENFNMTAGPDVFVFLSTTSSYNAGVIQVSQLAVNTTYTNSNINFTVDHPSYTSDYKYVLIYCVQYSHLFAYTELQ